MTVLTNAPSASALTTNRERFTALFTTLNGQDWPTTVIARGPIRGVGIETQTEVETANGQINYTTFHLPHGKLRVRFNESFAWAPNLATCLATGTGSGTFKVTGGTGAYRNAVGSGTFNERGLLVGARGPNNECLGPDSGVAPELVTVRVNALGHVTIDG